MDGIAVAPDTTIIQPFFFDQIWMGAVITISTIVIVIALLFFVPAILLWPDFRRLIKKFYYLFKSALCIEIGVGGLVRLVVTNCILPALLAAIPATYRSGGFQWNTFIKLFLLIFFIGFIINIFNQSMALKRILSPGAGRVWSARRKAGVSAILKKIAYHHRNSTRLDAPDIQEVLSDLLDVIVLHVRDHRGSFRDTEPDVFANILLEYGENMVVVARDRGTHRGAFVREIPKVYPKASLLCGRVMVHKQPLSVGILSDEYPETLKNKPYNSIIAIPLFDSNNTVYGVLSIDSTRPYFFQSFSPGKAENAIENTLQPYIQLITLILESLSNPNFENLVVALSTTSEE